MKRGANPHNKVDVKAKQENNKFGNKVGPFFLCSNLSIPHPLILTFSLVFPLLSFNSNLLSLQLLNYFPTFFLQAKTVQQILH
ncbi:hypothetical protein Lalb_Chr05g0226251 [Lupinus albus]|uniref:Uncharacterized protein n=1 Tax=Lupinus albus TaxID=3870 RepID=A0A6A4QJZ4_LUPAL|nr:hypothetical protein Lalb_Chr05g0226251 [Lupinus albus]